MKFLQACGKQIGTRAQFEISAPVSYLILAPRLSAPQHCKVPGTTKWHTQMYFTGSHFNFTQHEMEALRGNPET